jgi:hypothetical protein
VIPKKEGIPNVLHEEEFEGRTVSVIDCYILRRMDIMRDLHCEERVR